MPAIPSLGDLLETTLVHRSAQPPGPNATDPILEVICAWPVSGQYGPGTRYLYYILTAACVFARKEEWIRNACLAAVLLFPAVAALHGIVLAALHVDGAVDMDVYGAFQLCAIGILTAPATVRLSKTYFNNPGRNIIFLWTVLLLAGLLSLTVEFLRINPVICRDEKITAAWAETKIFNYTSSCGLQCTVEEGPQSPLRQGSANNIYVIPSPHELDFNTATLLAAACCIPAILSLVSTWIKILDKNWEKLSGGKRREMGNEPIEGTNGATPIQMTSIAEKIRGWLTLIEIPVFVAGVIAIIVKGEMNFWSEPVDYQTEPIASIGQWAPIVGTGLAVVGSLYLIFAADMEAEENKNEKPTREDVQLCTECGGNGICPSTNSSASSRRTSSSERPPSELERSATFSTIHQAMKSQSGPDPGGRRKVAQFFNAASAYIAAKAHKDLKDTGFEVHERTNFPEIPGEPFRNPDLNEIRTAYNTSPLPRSRATSFVGSDTSNGEGSSRTPRRQFPLPARPPLAAAHRRQHSNTLPTNPSTSEGGTGPTFLEIRSLYGNLPPRQWSPTDETAIDEQHDASRAPSISDFHPATLSSGPTTPKIVVSSD